MNDKKVIMKKLWLVIGILFALLVLYVVYLRVQIATGNLVKWEGKYYTKEALDKKYGPQVYEVESKNTPEEVYASFRSALIEGDYEKALTFIRLENREGYREAIFKNEEKTKEWIKTLPETITKESEEGNHAAFDINYGTNQKNTTSFTKNDLGYWEIDAI